MKPILIVTRIEGVLMRKDGSPIDWAKRLLMAHVAVGGRLLFVTAETESERPKMRDWLYLNTHMLTPDIIDQSLMMGTSTLTMAQNFRHDVMLFVEPSHFIATEIVKLGFPCMMPRTHLA